ncbi:major facilitator superfamily domain-containing protein [Copromyces sp. CBS 386.78]|nr:major facilitator superfamily domain-containing protein [Copromyces sp. CBS 386.78]
MGDLEKEVALHHEKSTPKDASSSNTSLPELSWTDAEERAIRRKIDWHCVPIVTVLYMFCFLDRVNIGNARIQGLGKDLNLQGTQFNWALSIFYIIYCLFEVPSNVLLKAVGPRFFLPLLVSGFGLVSLCTAFVTNFGGLMAARAVLGVFEGGAMPGMAFFLSTFYKRGELLFRIGIYTSAASLAGAFGGLLATGLAKIPEWGVAGHTLHTWKNIFFFEGLITIMVGLLAPIWMPTDPMTAFFLNERERCIAAERLVREHRADPAGKVEWRHVKLAVMNVHNYTCGLGFFMINITVQGLSVFLPTILKDLGWESTKAQLYSVPPYVCACAVAVAVAYGSDKSKQRGIWLAAFSVLAIIGFAILRWVSQPNVRYMAVFFVTSGAFQGGPGFLSWAINNSAGPAVRAVTSGYVLTLGTIGGIVATWAYIPDDAPKYHTGHTINLGGQIAIFCLSIFGIFYCAWENRARAAGKRDHRLQGLTEEQQEQLGNRHPRFQLWT